MLHPIQSEDYELGVHLASAHDLPEVLPPWVRIPRVERDPLHEVVPSDPRSEPSRTQLVLCPLLRSLGRQWVGAKQVGRGTVHYEHDGLGWLVGLPTVVRSGGTWVACFDVPRAIRFGGSEPKVVGTRDVVSHLFVHMG